MIAIRTRNRKTTPGRNIEYTGFFASRAEGCDRLGEPPAGSSIAVARRSVHAEIDAMWLTAATLLLTTAQRVILSQRTQRQDPWPRQA
jgi:hypothetical protein